MKVILFGATGMVGQGVLRECQNSMEVTDILTVGRTAVETKSQKVRNLVHADLWNYSAIERELSGFDACFFCLGTTAAGKSESEYQHITYGLTLAAATTLSRLNPQMTFVYVSGEGADSTEKGNVMWARVRGATENALLSLPFKGAYVFRPGIIQPLHGIESKTKAYRLFYCLAKPVLPLMRSLFPNAISTTEQIGKAMIQVAKSGAERRVLKPRDFEKLYTQH